MQKDVSKIAKNARDKIASLAQKSKAVFKDAAQKISVAMNGERPLTAHANAEQENSEKESPEQESASEESAVPKKRGRKAKEKNEGKDGEGYSTFGELCLLSFLAILDFAASLVFIAAIIVAIKPALLRGSVDANLYEFSSFTKKIGDFFMKIEFIKYNGDKNLRMIQAFATGAGLLLFALLKIFILTAAKNGTKKVISVLTLAMTLLACFMLSDKFLLFAIFVLLLYVCFEYSCRFPPALVFIKLALVSICAVILYVAIHFAFEPELRAAAVKIFDALKFPVMAWR